ncbi:NADH dehydrogenase I subunit J [Candidatus Kinetoplastibacterium desouzaii TCC079E]|uniref:NADH-quinone oxidoreductase subunit J n=1 Tax=Candidatus Kinetoplastidibacterium desouzai TCC079E TaxID=1208919 RepID=M1L2R3_9PROT|nr:NADH-quinone oxidoreductase subunit J [Candidatus Kinetoplastibacterium desouzaii]AGF47043.1 NADH dehydrogenase I subunit J [Candidatus Kinetoplastibacterium desouzaii TCC079E]
MSFVDFIFFFLSVISVLSAISVITANNPVMAVLQLISVFLNVSMIWMLLGAEFLSLLLVLVYVGAVMVLFLFVVMMIDVKYTNEFLGKNITLAFILALVIVSESFMVLWTTWKGDNYSSIINSDVSNSFLIGSAMYSNYIMAVELGAVILLVGMMSAIVLALRSRKDNKTNDLNMALKADPNNRVLMIKFPKNMNNYYIIKKDLVSSKEEEK